MAIRVTPFLDATCPTCRDQGKGEYRMAATCSNCGKVMAIVLSKGHATPGWNEGPECPVCGCKNWNGWKDAVSG